MAEKNDLEATKLAMRGLIDKGDVLAACPICKEYLSYSEYNLSTCGKCKKIDFLSILYYPGLKKDSN